VLKLGPGPPAAASAQNNLAQPADQPGGAQKPLTGPAAKPAKP